MSLILCNIGARMSLILWNIGAFKMFGLNGSSLHGKSTVVIEHFIQASDVSHTMQHWCIYNDWTEWFFFEF